MARHDAADESLARALRGALDVAADEHPDEGQLALYLTRELAPDALERFERHVAGCARCADELAVASAVEADAAGGFAATAPPSVARDDIARPARVTREAPRRRRRSWLRIAAAVAVVVLAGGAVAGNYVVGRLQPVLIDGMASMLGRPVSGGDASLVLAGGPGLRLDDVQIAEDPSFGAGDFARVQGAVLRVDPGELLRGRVRGAIELDEPAVHLVRDAQGRWNVESLAGRGGKRVDLPADLPADAQPPSEARAREAKERLVRLTSASIRNGTLELTDRSRGGNDVVLRDVDLTYASSDPRAAGAIDFSSSLGGAQRVALRGEIGPFEGGAQPRYRFDQVLVQHLPLADIPGAPAALTGELTFDGTLASEGSGMDAVVRNASGDGALGLCCGELRERNLTAELVAALGREDATASDVLARAKGIPALAAALAQGDTPFEEITGEVAIAAGTLKFDDLALDTALFRASATGSLAWGGAIDAHGTVTLTAAATTALGQLLPEAKRLFSSGAELEVPFKVAGTWPDVRLEVDVRTAIARLARPLDPRSLLLARLRG